MKEALNQEETVNRFEEIFNKFEKRIDSLIQKVDDIIQRTNGMRQDMRRVSASVSITRTRFPESSLTKPLDTVSLTSIFGDETEENSYFTLFR